jgi:hypothetical protein
LFLQIQESEATNLDDLRKLKMDFENKYNVPLYFESIPYAKYTMDYEIVTDEYYEYLFNYIKLLDKEFAKYPQPYLRTTRLRAVVLVRLLTNSGGYLVAAIPDFYRKVLFLDFKRGIYSKNYQEHTIHHDFFHMVERELGENSKINNDIWQNYDPKAKYGKTGWTKINSKSHDGLMNHPEPGFSSNYGKTAIEEDKAQIYGQLFIPEYSKKLLKWSQSDKVLAKKITHIKSFLEKHESSFNKQFWEKLHHKLPLKPIK